MNGSITRNAACQVSIHAHIVSSSLYKSIVKLPAESEPEAFVLFCCFWLQQKFLM